MINERIIRIYEARCFACDGLLASGHSPAEAAALLVGAQYSKVYPHPGPHKLCRIYCPTCTHFLDKTAYTVIPQNEL